MCLVYTRALARAVCTNSGSPLLLPARAPARARDPKPQRLTTASGRGTDTSHPSPHYRADVHKTAGMPHVPGPAQTAVLARFVCHCLSVSGLLRLGVQCLARARKTRKRTAQDSCIPHVHEKAQGKAHSLLFSFRSESFGCCCRSEVARNRIELSSCSGDTK